MTPLKKARIRAGISIYELARQTGIDRGNLSRLERGLAGMSRDNVAILARHLKISELEILYPERYMSTPQAGEWGKTPAARARKRSVIPQACDLAE